MNQHTRVDIAMNVGAVDVRQIHPRDKRFSPNLYWWARREKMCGFYKLTRNCGDYSKGEIFVGRMYSNTFRGNSLRRVLCYGLRKEGQVYAFIQKDFISALVADVASEKRYLKNGRCGLYPKHNMGFIGQWMYDGDRRTCNFCGATSVRVKTGERIVEEFRWEMQK